MSKYSESNTLIGQTNGKHYKIHLKCPPKHSMYNLSLPLLFGSGCLQGLVCALPFFAVMHLWMMLPACNTHGGFFLIPAALLQAPADIKQYFLCQNKTSSSISPKSILTVPSPNNDTTVDTTFLGLSQESSTDPTY